MQKVKFFYIFNKKNIKKDCFWGKSLRKGVQYFLFISYLYLIIFLTLGILTQDKRIESIIFLLLKFLIYSLLDFLSLNYFLQSINSFFFKQAKLALDLLNLSIIWKIILYILKTIIFLIVYIKLSFLDFKTKTIEDHSEIYELIFIIIQILFYNILFSFTAQLSEGNDALVDGQEFNRYVENFTIFNSFSRRSVFNSENSIQGDDRNNRRENLNMQMANINFNFEDSVNNNVINNNSNIDNNNQDNFNRNINRDYSFEDNNSNIIDDLN
jgi:hypothetical protein